MRTKWMLTFIVSLSMFAPVSFAQQDEINECLVEPSIDQVTLKLDPECPLGDGLWGDVPPRHADSILWIQCRFDQFPMPPQAYSFLYANVSETIVEQYDGKGYRCLIGPYADHQQASLEQRHLKAHPHFNTVFLREVKRL